MNEDLYMNRKKMTSDMLNSGIIKFSIPVIFMMLYVMTNFQFLFYTFFLISIYLGIKKPIYLVPVYMISSFLDVGFESYGSISKFLFFIIVISFLRTSLTRNFRFQTNNFLFLLVILLFSFISTLTSISQDFNAFFQILMNVVMFFIITNLVVKDTKVFLEILIFTFILTLFFYIATLVINWDIVSFQISIGDRVSLDERFNPNRFSMALVQMSSGLVGYFLIKRKFTLYKLIIILIILISIFLIFISGSRSSLIGIIGALIFSQLFLSNSKNIYKRISGLLILGGAILIAYNLVNLIDPHILDRFTIASILESGGTGRLNIWRVLFSEVIPENLLFGVGIGGENVIIAISPYLTLPKPAHNFIIDMLVQVGIVGVFIFMLFYVKNVIKIFRNIKYNPYLSIPVMMILAAIFNGIGETIYLERFFWNSLALGILIVSATFKENSNENEKAMYKNENIKT